MRPPRHSPAPWTTPAPLAEEWVVTILPAPSVQWLARIKTGTPPELSRLGLWVDARDLEPCSQPAGHLPHGRVRIRLGGMTGREDVEAMVSRAACPEGRTVVSRLLSMMVPDAALLGLEGSEPLFGGARPMVLALRRPSLNPSP
jgi:hypothetical protein